MIGKAPYQSQQELERQKLRSQALQQELELWKERCFRLEQREAEQATNAEGKDLLKINNLIDQVEFLRVKLKQKDNLEEENENLN